MDYEYWLRLGKAGARFGYLEEKLAGSRLYAENKTLGARVMVHREINDIMKLLFGKVPDTWLMNYAHAVVECKVDRSKSPRKFVVKLAITAVLATLIWNYSISSGMWHTVSSWLNADGKA